MINQPAQTSLKFSTARRFANRLIYLQLRTQLGKEKGRRKHFPAAFEIMAPQVGLEPTTLRLTAECSAIELLRNKRPHIVKHYYVQGAKRFL